MFRQSEVRFTFDSVSGWVFDVVVFDFAETLYRGIALRGSESKVNA